MTALVRGELIKAVTTRTILGYAAIAVALSIIWVLVATLSADVVGVADKRGVIAGGPIVLLLFGIVGGAGEYRHRTAAPAALAATDRVRLTIARVNAYGISALAIGLVTVTVTLAIGVPLVSGEPGPGLEAVDITVIAAGTLAAAALSAMMGVAVGTLLRNQVAGVVGALILAFVVQPLIPQIDRTVGDFTPIGAGLAAAGNGDAATLAPGWATLVLAGWTMAFAVGAALVERRRDVA